MSDAVSADPVRDLAQAILDGRVSLSGQESVEANGTRRSWTFTVEVVPPSGR